MDAIVVSGSVVHGLKQGRELGYPTINIAYVGELPVRAGVYAARVKVGEREFSGAGIVGGDFVSSAAPKLEVHLLGGDHGDLYGAEAVVELFMYVSELRQISDISMLREKIAADVAAIEKLF